MMTQDNTARVKLMAEIRAAVLSVIDTDPAREWTGVDIRLALPQYSAPLVSTSIHKLIGDGDLVLDERLQVRRSEIKQMREALERAMDR